MTVIFENICEGVDIVRQFLVPRAFTARLLEFAKKEGICSVMEEMGSFTREEFHHALEQRLGYAVRDPVRERMLNILLDFFEECGKVVQRSPRGFAWTGFAKPVPPLSSEESRTMEHVLGDQVFFFRNCIEYAGDFLRGGAPLYSFKKGTEEVWNRFLGNYEFAVARDILLKAMTIDANPDFTIMDLCYGTGNGLEAIQRGFPEAHVTAIDFTDELRPFVVSKIGNDAARTIQWIDSTLWKGFGNALPFQDGIFDRIFFSCGDPYIPEHLRPDLYRDVFRILKPGGIFGVIAWAYPDRERIHLSHEWMREGIYIHDFAESVCDGWCGFHNIDDTVAMAQEIGFVEHPLFNSFYLLDSAVWVFKKP